MSDDRVDYEGDTTPPRIVGAYKVSARGRMSLPAGIRRRWGIEEGGQVEIADLGESLLIVPGGDGTLRRTVLGGISPEAYQEYVDSIDDPDLRDE
jgi:AbrB family looped-hinge helix DNA binding protein